MATQFNRRQIRALIKESLYQMVYDKPSDMYDEEMDGLDAWEADTQGPVPTSSLVKSVTPNEYDTDEMEWADYDTDEDDVPFGAADVALKIGHDHRRKRAQRGDD